MLHTLKYIIVYNCFLNQLGKEKRKICLYTIHSYAIGFYFFHFHAHLSFPTLPLPSLTPLPWPPSGTFRPSSWHSGGRGDASLPPAAVGAALQGEPHQSTGDKGGVSELSAFRAGLGVITEQGHHGWAPTVCQDQTCNIQDLYPHNSLAGKRSSCPCCRWEGLNESDKSPRTLEGDNPSTLRHILEGRQKVSPGDTPINPPGFTLFLW